MNSDSDIYRQNKPTMGKTNLVTTATRLMREVDKLEIFLKERAITSDKSPSLLQPFEKMSEFIQEAKKIIDQDNIRLEKCLSEILPMDEEDSITYFEWREKESADRYLKLS